jgi:hypothetical protein
MEQFQTNRMTTIDYGQMDVGGVDPPKLLLLHGFPSRGCMFRNLIQYFVSPVRDELDKQQKFASGSITNIASTPVALTIRAGAPPDISTVDALRSARCSMPNRSSMRIRQREAPAGSISRALSTASGSPTS